jgi:hypothetical protein
MNREKAETNCKTKDRGCNKNRLVPKVDRDIRVVNVKEMN